MNLSERRRQNNKTEINNQQRINLLSLSLIIITLSTIMSAAEEAIARAKAIAARLAGTGATLSTTPGGDDEHDNHTTTTTTTTATTTDVNSVAEAALAAAFGTAGPDGGGNGSKRKRWGESSGEGMFVGTRMYNWVIHCTVFSTL